MATLIVIVAVVTIGPSAVISKIVPGDWLSNRVCSVVPSDVADARKTSTSSTRLSQSSSMEFPVISEAAQLGLAGGSTGVSVDGVSVILSPETSRELFKAHPNKGQRRPRIHNK